MKTIQKIKENFYLKWGARIIVLFIAFLILNDGLRRLSINNDAQVFIGVFQILLVACFIVCLARSISNKIDNKQLKQTQEQENNGQSKNSN